MAYAQWLEIIITNRMRDGDVTLRDAVANWGKFYQNGDKDIEIGSDQINGNTLTFDKSFTVQSCGRSDSASGTEGSVKLFEGSTHICTLYWNCPWGSKNNQFKILDQSDDYAVSHTPFNDDSGAIGTVKVKVLRG
ncbi:hypothetical protein TD95_000962 [Thielaviopsis punctulata]|uniref:Aegerolysin Aa-Pri1 n=1 Tax=Thielaviopsis punctulata TaxID=72032 RepID=A0A0F4ZDE5_9PEZI|nr:hypothetical protein TD95_000962 [Thielaviopsis punctulata]